MLAPAEVGGNSRWFVGTFFADNGAPGDRGFWWNPGPGGPSAASEAGDALSRMSISIGVAEPGGKIYPLCWARYIGAKRNGNRRSGGGMLRDISAGRKCS